MKRYPKKADPSEFYKLVEYVKGTGVEYYVAERGEKNKANWYYLVVNESKMFDGLDWNVLFAKFSQSWKDGLLDLQSDSDMLTEQEHEKGYAGGLTADDIIRRFESSIIYPNKDNNYFIVNSRKTLPAAAAMPWVGVTEAEDASSVKNQNIIRLRKDPWRISPK